MYFSYLTSFPTNFSYGKNILNLIQHKQFKCEILLTEQALFSYEMQIWLHFFMSPSAMAGSEVICCAV